VMGSLPELPFFSRALGQVRVEPVLSKRTVVFLWFRFGKGVARSLLSREGRTCLRPQKREPGLSPPTGLPATGSRTQQI